MEEVMGEISTGKTHVLRPCDPDRLNRSGVPSVGARSPFRESREGQEEERSEDSGSLAHETAQSKEFADSV